MNSILHILNGLSTGYEIHPNFKRLVSVLNENSASHLKKYNILHFPSQLFWGEFSWKNSLEEWIQLWSKCSSRHSKEYCANSSMKIDNHEAFACFIEMLNTSKFKEIIIWCTASLADQLYLIWVITILKKMNLDLTRVKVKYITHNGGFESRTLGEFNDALFYAERKGFYLDKIIVDHLIETWKVLNNDNPQQLINFIENSSNWHSLINHKIQSLFLWFPDKEKGISTWEYRMLIKCKEIEYTSINYIIGNASGTFEDSFGYDWMNNMIYNLSDLGEFKNPLFIMDANKKHVKLTDLGRKIRNGTANNFNYNTYQRKVLGIKLDSGAKTIWCYNNQTSWLEVYKTS